MLFVCNVRNCSLSPSSIFSNNNFYRFSWWKIILILVVIVGTISYTFNNIKELIDGIEEYRNYIKRAKIARKKLFSYMG